MMVISVLSLFHFFNRRCCYVVYFGGAIWCGGDLNFFGGEMWYWCVEMSWWYSVVWWWWYGFGDSGGLLIWYGSGVFFSGVARWCVTAKWCGNLTHLVIVVLLMYFKLVYKHDSVVWYIVLRYFMIVEGKGKAWGILMTSALISATLAGELVMNQNMLHKEASWVWWTNECWSFSPLFYLRGYLSTHVMPVPRRGSINVYLGSLAKLILGKIRRDIVLNSISVLVECV